MSNVRLTSFALGAAVLCLLSTSANAGVITLDDIPLDYRSQNLPSYTEGRFNISASCTNCLNVFSTVEANAGYSPRVNAAGWGASERFLETWNTNVIFTLTETSGNAFNFLGFDMGVFSNSSNDASWTVRAYDHLGALIADDAYTGRGHFDFNYWNVSSIALQNKGGYSSFDNLEATVPEPSMLALLGAGLIGLGLTRRRKLNA